MNNISLYENFIREIDSLSLAKIIKQIRGSKYKKPVLEIRKLIKLGDLERANQVKRTLVAFTVSGVFKGGPKMVFLQTYNPLVILNINNLDPHLLRYLIFRTKHIEFTKAVFVSPGGRGLKIIVEVDSEMKKHDLAWQQVCDFYEEQLDVAVENKGDKITRLCFMSHDPDAYFNPESSVYKVAASRIKKGKSLEEKILDTTSVKSIETVKKVVKISRKFPPAIPLQVYDKLPGLLKESCSPFRNRHQKRDVFLTGALGFLSGILPGVSGMYRDRLCFPNLNVFVVAPPASGKSAYNLARHLGKAYNNELLEANEKKESEYSEALKYYKRDLFRYEKGDLTEEPKAPTKPNFKYSSISTSIEPADLTGYLNRNDGSGMIFDSDAEVLGNILNHYQGEYSNLLENAFQHEYIVWGWKSDGSLIEVSQPKLSVCLSGTPDQLTKFIPSFENGLLSTFMFYIFRSAPVWQIIPSDSVSVGLQDFYEELSEDVLEMIHFLEAHPATFDLTGAQWKLMRSTFQKIFEETYHDYGTRALGIVRRMELNCFRMAMILSAIRKFEEKDSGKELICREDDFQAAILLAENYLKHGLFAYENLPEPPEKSFCVA